MSAYIEDKAHIDALVRVAIEGPADRGPSYPGDGWSFYYYHAGEAHHARHEEAERLGAMLTAQNVRSVQARYPSDGMDDLPGPIENGWLTDAMLGIYHYPAYGTGPVRIGTAPRHLTALEALQAVDGYEYQACEDDGWKESEAHTFCDALRKRLVMALPGYDQCDTWGISQPVKPTWTKEQAELAGKHRAFHITPADWCPACITIVEHDGAW
jgi:hypothetical protein